MGNEIFKNTISVSQIGAFQDCQYKWQLLYKEHIRVQTGDITPSAIGSVVHVAIASALMTLFKIQDKKAPSSDAKLGLMLMSAQRAIQAWHMENYKAKQTAIMVGDEQIEMAHDVDHDVAWHDMLANAMIITQRALKQLDIVNRYKVVGVKVGRKKVPLVEFWLDVDISPEINLGNNTFGFSGVVDAVLYNMETGITEVIDWKLHKRFTTFENEQLSSQLALYQHALRVKYGVDAQLGVVYQIKRDPPRKPELNLNGTMSRRKITSDWATYEQALIDAGLNPDDYRDEMQLKLADVEFFRPVMVFRSAEIAKMFWQNMLSYAITIIGTEHFPMALGYACRNCQFAALCQARIYGYDEGSLFEDKYVKKEEDVILIAEEDMEVDIGE